MSKPEKQKRPQHVFTLVVQVGRKDGDGLPDGIVPSPSDTSTV